MVSLLCPVCGKALQRSEKSYACENRHSFDRHKRGYVNLLLSSAQGHHGDDKLMVRARREFLDKGYYDRLAAEIAAAAVQYAPKNAAIIDAGCGEGMYTQRVLREMEAAGKAAEILGVDISKTALQYAAVREPRLTLAVASVSRLPVSDQSADVLLNIFAPYVPEEFSRVLRADGVLLRAYPLEKHLWELKQLIYDTPYLNPPTPLETDGFSLIETREVRYPIHLPCNEDIGSLFRMTPYYYKTGRSDQAKAEAAQELDVTLEFGIAVYRKH